MLGFYIKLSRLIKELGVNVVSPGVSHPLKTYKCLKCSLHHVVDNNRPNYITKEVGLI